MLKKYHHVRRGGVTRAFENFTVFFTGFSTPQLLLAWDRTESCKNHVKLISEIISKSIVYFRTFLDNIYGSYDDIFNLRNKNVKYIYYILNNDQHVCDFGALQNHTETVHGCHRDITLKIVTTKCSNLFWTLSQLYAGPKINIHFRIYGLCSMKQVKVANLDV